MTQMLSIKRMTWVYATRTFVEILEGRPERDAHEVVARRVEQVTTVRRVNVEEDAGDDNRLLLQELLEERLRTSGVVGYMSLQI